jgi:hypothetical protein
MEHDHDGDPVTRILKRDALPNTTEFDVPSSRFRHTAHPTTIGLRRDGKPDRYVASFPGWVTTT